MSYFSTQLGAICAAHGTQVVFAGVLGVDQALLSRYLRGSVRPSHDFLAKIAEKLPEFEQTALFIAHAVDELPASARNLVHIEPAGGYVQETATASDYFTTVKLPDDLREAFEFLQKECIENPALADHILTTARLLRGR